MTSTLEREPTLDGEPPILAEAIPRRRSWPIRWAMGVASAVHWCFGAVSLVLGLAVLATFPVLQFLSLGYLLEAAGRISRTGRLREGFVGVRKAAHVGGLVLGTWLLLLPLRFLSDLWHSASLVDPLSDTTRGLRVALVIATILLVGQILWAWYRGGRLRHFFWPAPVRLVQRLFRGGKYVEARDAVWEFVTGLRLPYYFWLGVRGFAGAALWLVVPALLLIGGTTLPPGPALLSGWLGALSMAWVVLHLPFLQVRFAEQNRFGCFFELREIRERFRRAPLAFWFAVLITLLFALPLYLLKIELTPREVAGLTSVVFVAFILPARLLTGWALARANRRATRRWWITRWTARLGMLPVVGLYVLIVFISRYTSWHGVWSSFEQHAFLVPVPFLGL